MKTIIFTLIFVLFSIEVYTQSNLIIRTKAGTGTYTSFSIDDIDRIDFAPCGIVDYGGQTYYTVKIGDQCWFAQNLNIGTRINGSVGQTNNNPNYIEKYCYNDEPDSCDVYGGLYQWDEAMQYVTTEGAQGICPSGWHIPTLTEFEALQTTVGGSTYGNALKAIGQGTEGGAGTNTSGFSALLAGYRSYFTNFASLGFTASFWSSNESDVGSPNANYLWLYYGVSNIYFYSDAKEGGFSIRCIKD